VYGIIEILHYHIILKTMEAVRHLFCAWCSGCQVPVKHCWC